MKNNLFISKIFAAFLVLLTFQFAAIAQKVSESEIWKTQAKSLAQTYGLNDKVADNLSKAYVEVRQEVYNKNKETDKEANPEEYKATTEKNQAEGQVKIKKEIDKILTGQQAEEAVLLLGSFNSRWDSWQKILVDFKLSDEKMASASKSLTEYMKVYIKARKMADDSGNRLSGKTATELKLKLDNALAGILSQTQKAEWDTATQRKTKSK